MEGRLADEPEPLRQLGGPGQGGGGVGEAVLGVGDGAEHRLGVHQSPAVLDGGQVPHRLGRRPGGADGVAQHDRPEGAEQEAGRRLPGQVEPPVGRPRWRPASSRTSWGRPCWMRRNARCRSASARRRSSPSRSATARAPSRSSWAWSTLPADASSQPASSRPVAWSRGAAWSRAASSALRTRAAPATPSPSTTQVQPNPLAMRRPSAGSWAAAQARAASMLARSARTRARQSGWARPRTVAAHRSAASANQAAWAARGVVDLARHLEAAGGEGADAVEQPVADGAVLGGLDAQHGPVGEPADHVDRRAAGDAERGQDMLGRGQGRPAGEAGQRPEPPLVVGEEQVVAPGDGGGEGPASFGPPAGRVLEQGEAVVEAPGDLLDRQRPDPGGGQLDGQGQPVEGPADVLDGGGGVVVEDEPPAHPGRAVGEQRHRVGQRQRVQRVDGLAVDARAAPGWSRGSAGGGARSSSRVARSATPSMTCSQLSRTQHRLGAREAVQQRLLAPGELQRLGHHLRDRGGASATSSLTSQTPAGGAAGSGRPRGRCGSCRRPPARPASPAGCRRAAGRRRPGRRRVRPAAWTGRAGCRDQGRRRPGGGGAASRAALCRRTWPSRVAQRRPRLDAELVDEQPAHPR